MATISLYHNPSCSKSRTTLALLQERGHEPTVIEYLQTPLDEASLKAILSKLGMEPSELVRKTEPHYRELELEGKTGDDLIQAMLENPILIERPIVVYGDKARIGRPPERVLEILP